MSGMRVIRITSRALGHKVTVRVHVYDDLNAMRAAATAYNGTAHHDALGVTQARIDSAGRAQAVIVRLWRGRLGTQVVTHELHHAATALWGASVPDTLSVRRHQLNHFNEPAAHLFSDLAHRLVDRLYDLGYYDRKATT